MRELGKITGVFLAMAFSLAVMANPAGALENERILWEYAGSLPAQEGFDENIGTAGLLQGIIGDYIVVGGGANFPYKPLLDGGEKVTHKDIYLLAEKDSRLTVVDQIQLYPLAYGGSASLGDSVYYLGGSPEEAHRRDVLKITVKDGKLEAEKAGEIPLSFESGICRCREGKIYFGIGKIEDESGKLVNSNRFFSYDVGTNSVKELAPFPGEKRQQPVGEILGGKLCVFSGGSDVAYVDGYSYDFAKDSWSRISDSSLGDEFILLLGAGSVRLNDDEMLVIGGFSRKLWDDANYSLGTLKGQELADYKRNYFGAEPFRYNWNRRILVYSASKDQWRSIGEVPFDAPCGQALLFRGNEIYSINGEIKPGVRTPRMFRGIFFKR